MLHTNYTHTSHGYTPHHTRTRQADPFGTKTERSDDGRFGGSPRSPGGSPSKSKSSVMEGAGPLVGHRFPCNQQHFEVTDHVEVVTPSPLLSAVLQRLRAAIRRCQNLQNKLESQLRLGGDGSSVRHLHFAPAGAI